MADSKVNLYSPITAWLGPEMLYAIQSALDKNITLTTLFANIPVLAKFAGRIGLGTDHNVISNSGVVDVTKTITQATNTLASIITLPAGSFDGQIIIIILTSASAITTLSGSLGPTSIALPVTGSSATLLFTQSKWWYIGGSATVS